MRYRIAAALLLFLGGAVMVLAGAGFACYAIYANLLLVWGPPMAAAITAAILLFVPVAGLVLLAILARRTRKNFLERLRDAAEDYRPPLDKDDVTLAFLAGLAREKPLTAVLLAALFGASSAQLRGRK